MKQFLFWSLVLAGLAAAGAVGYQHYSASRSASGQFRTKAVHRGDVTLVVNSTGTVQPVLSVQVGAFVSGPIKEVCVDFNDKVKKDQTLAQIDPRTYIAAEAHESAGLAHAKADLTRVEALLEHAIRFEQRNIRLKKKGAIAENDYEQSITDRKSLEAQIELCKAAILQSEADLTTAHTNFEFTRPHARLEIDARRFLVGEHLEKLERADCDFVTHLVHSETCKSHDRFVQIGQIADRDVRPNHCRFPQRLVADRLRRSRGQGRDIRHFRNVFHHSVGRLVPLVISNPFENFDAFGVGVRNGRDILQRYVSAVV